MCVSPIFNNLIPPPHFCIMVLFLVAEKMDMQYRKIRLFMKSVKRLFWLLAIGPMVAQAAGNNFQIEAFNLNGQISWTNAFTNGVCTVEAATRLNGTTATRPGFHGKTISPRIPPGGLVFRSRPAKVFSGCWR